MTERDRAVKTARAALHADPAPDSAPPTAPAVDALELLLTRRESDGDATIGRLAVDGESFCYTCEDEHREEKVAGETRIPAGRYRIALRNAGGMVARYNRDFADVDHRGMLHLQDVPGFTWIYLHVGNDESHTAGCVLVGFERYGFRLGRSRDAYRALYRRVAAAAEEGRLFITIEDEPNKEGEI
jgi:hypothetical protein